MGGAEAYYKSNLDLVLRENKALKARLDQLDAETRLLKRSLYDLTLRHSACLERLGCSAEPLSLDTTPVLPADLTPSLTLHQLPRSSDQSITSSAGRVGGQAKQQSDGVYLLPTAELKGHMGAVYSAQFAPTGRLLASGSFDRSVRLWDTAQQREVACLEEHQLSVADVCWSADGARVLSAGFDHSVKEWDPAGGRAVHSYDTRSGFVQAVCCHPNDGALFVAAGTAKRVYVFDRRQGSAAAMELECEGKVSSVVVSCAWTCVSGDSRGALKEWDLRTAACLASRFNDPTHKPISCLAFVEPQDASLERESQLAVNSDENVLRVYDASAEPAGDFSGGHVAALQLRHAIEGTRSEHWSIRCSLLRGALYSSRTRSESQRTGGGDGRDARSRGWLDGHVQEALLLASGSADPYAYVFDVSGPQGSAELVQRLEGHADRVCGATWHPREALLATYSADCSVRLWAPQRRA